MDFHSEDLISMVEMKNKARITIFKGEEKCVFLLGSFVRGL